MSAVVDGHRAVLARSILAGILLLLARQSALATLQQPRDPSAAVAEANCGMLAPDPGQGWQPTDLDFRTDYRRLGMMESLYSAANPDLRQFERNGGKLLIYQGWNDPYEPPAAATRYYETVVRLVGGLAATQRFHRLFMVPGMGHCSGGEGAWAIDYLSYLERWVERGEAPDELEGWHMRLQPNPAEPPRFPPRSGEATFSRPVYPYPLRSMYKGTGDPMSGTSFRVVSGK